MVTNRCAAAVYGLRVLLYSDMRDRWLTVRSAYSVAVLETICEKGRFRRLPALFLLP
jgi:hypothetical protein